MISNLGYREYRPSGFTDDLGIIADRNQWVDAQLPGWYVRVNGNGLGDVLAWLEDNGLDYQRYRDDRRMLILADHDAVIAMTLRWG